MSTKPGHTTSPSGISITVAPSTGRSTPTRAIRSPSIRTSRTPSIPLAGSTTRPPLSSLFMFSYACQEVKNRHPDGNAVGDLLENYRIGSVCDLRRDFYAAVHRTGMHDEHIGFGELQPRF